MASKDDSWVQRFLVSDPLKHKKGFTLYKVTSVVFPKKYPEAATKVVVWKRYNDFKKLHSELKQRHSKLQLGGKFPPFVKAKYFSRFEDEVIEERRRAAFLLLEFIAKHPPLYNAEIFIKFFENGYTVVQEAGTGALFADSDSASTSRFLSAPDIQNDGGAHSLSSEDDVSSYTNEEYPDTSFQGSSQDVHLSEERSPAGAYGQESLNCQTEDSTDLPPSRTLRLLENGISKRLWSLTSGRLRMNTFSDSNEKPGYCYTAEQYVEEAELKEATKNHRAAFDLYKKAISCWLSGVQSDMNHNRRNMIKEKTSMYLLRAEFIANNYLTDEIPETAGSEVLPLSELWRPVERLATYKVLSIIGKVMLVMDTSTHVLYVIKALHKTGLAGCKTKKCILPRGSPYMVHLHAIHETDCAVYLVLQHISTGKLWDYVTPYFIKTHENDTKSHIEWTVSDDISYSLPISDVSLKDPLTQSNTDLTLTFNSSQSSLSSQGDSYLNNEFTVPTTDVSDLQFQVQAPVINKADSKADWSVNNNLSEVKSGFTKFEKPEMVIEDTSGIHVNVIASNQCEPQFDVFMKSRTCDQKINKNNCDIETDILVENAQRLLKSVSETLCRSESIVTNIDRKDLNSVHSDRKFFFSTGNIVELCNSEPDAKEFDENNPGNNNRLFENDKPERAVTSCTLHPSSLLPEHARGTSPVSSGSEVGELQWMSWGIEGRGINSDMLIKWASQLLVAINYLHLLGIIFRDLNPENLLVDSEGNLRLTYQCQFPGVDPVLDYRAVNSLFTAPECLSIQDITKSVDWWSYGAIMFNLITGKSLCYYHPGGIFEHSIIHIPDYVPVDARSLLEQLLKFDSSQRLGSGTFGVEEIKSHPFFDGVNWDQVSKDGCR